MRWLLPLLTLASVGCAKKREPAPEAMEDLVRYIYRNYDDPKELEDGTDGLIAWLEPKMDTEELTKGYALSTLTTEDVSVAHPDRSFEGLLGAAGGARSVVTIDEHAASSLLIDQVWQNPSNYDAYERSFSGDGPAFKAREGDVLTDNDITTGNFGVSIPYTLFKDYRWVQGESDRQAIIARSWIEEAGCNEGGGSCLELSFSIDVWIEDGDETWRFTAGWSEVTSPFSGAIGDDLMVAALANGYQSVFESSDEFLTTNDID